MPFVTGIGVVSASVPLLFVDSIQSHVSPVGATLSPSCQPLLVLAPQLINAVLPASETSRFSQNDTLNSPPLPGNTVYSSLGMVIWLSPSPIAEPWRPDTRLVWSV